MSMKYFPYPEYKESGYERLSKIPSSWNVSKVKFLGNYINGYAFKPSDWGDQGKEIIRIQNLTSNDSNQVNYYNGSIDKKYLIKKGDYLLSWSATLGLFEWNRNDGWLNQHIFKVTVNPEVNRPFFKWLANWFLRQMDQDSHGSTMQHLTKDKFGGFAVSLPKEKEQQQIANFLNHETAKIDTLIEKQQQLIKLLKEKRQAVISHAVTKGLNPDVPMKDSGVEWLGEVPAHWKRIKIKRLFQFVKRQGFSDLKVLSVYRDYGVIAKSSRSDNHNKTPENLSLYQLVNKNDLVINKMKAWQGSMGISSQKGITSPDYAVYKPLEAFEDHYLHYWLRASHMPDVYLNISTGIRPSQWRLDLQEFEHLIVYLPSESERIAIEMEIRLIQEKYFQLISLAEAQICILKERRTALISAAVTGKIDVRNFKAGDTNAA